MDSSDVKYPIGIQTFSEIRKGNYIYVDKTSLVYRLANKGKYYFMARPRRFGKSLLLTTLQAYFEGRKELFKGLAIEKLEEEWTEHPVLLLSLATYNKYDGGNLEAILNNYFQQWEKDYHVENIDIDLSMRFRNIIKAARQATGRNVVILIDEYDAPLVAHLGEEDAHAKVRGLLKSIYVNIKEMDSYLRFAMLTGVSRFSKTSVFSGLNNLNDITLNPIFGTVCGITEDELLSCFHEGITAYAHTEGISERLAIEKLKQNYDGYHFTAPSPDIYNPFSVLNALASSKIGSYWFASGTPTFLLDAIRHTDNLLPFLLNKEVDEVTLGDIDTYKKSPEALMFQTGYLTIKEYDSDLEEYRLGIPNREVRAGLTRGLIQTYMDMDASDAKSVVKSLLRTFRNGQPDEALEYVKAFLAKIPYELAHGKDEIYFENNLYLLFTFLGLNTKVEYHTNRGRIDLLLETPDYIYVMELKLDGTAQEALDQIDAKGYADQFSTDLRRLFKIGINFSRETRNIDTWIIR